MPFPHTLCFSRICVFCVYVEHICCFAFNHFNGRSWQFPSMVIDKTTKTAFEITELWRLDRAKNKQQELQFDLKEGLEPYTKFLSSLIFLYLQLDVDKKELQSNFLTSFLFENISHTSQQFQEIMSRWYFVFCALQYK